MLKLKRLPIILAVASVLVLIVAGALFFKWKTNTSIKEEIKAEISDARKIAEVKRLKGAIAAYIEENPNPKFCYLDEAGNAPDYYGENGSNAVDGTGWLPIDFNSLPGGSPIESLPSDIGVLCFKNGDIGVSTEITSLMYKRSDDVQVLNVECFDRSRDCDYYFYEEIVESPLPYGWEIRVNESDESPIAGKTYEIVFEKGGALRIFDGLASRSEAEKFSDSGRYFATRSEIFDLEEDIAAFIPEKYSGYRSFWAQDGDRLVSFAKIDGRDANTEIGILNSEGEIMYEFPVWQTWDESPAASVLVGDMALYGSDLYIYKVPEYAEEKDFKDSGSDCVVYKIKIDDPQSAPVIVKRVKGGVKNNGGVFLCSPVSVNDGGVEIKLGK